jgi:hypothetical protein
MSPAPQQTAVSVERLALHVPSMSEDEARRLAEEVAQALRRWPVGPPAGRIESLTANVEPTGDRSALAEQIARAVAQSALRELA